MTKPLSFQAVRQLEARTPRPATRQSGDVTRERLIQSGAIKPAGELDARPEVHANDRPVLTLDSLGRRAAARDVKRGRERERDE